jgi:type VI secretion system protein ImpG
LRALGFEEEEALLPRAPQSFDGYRLLQEYFAMPERFLFVELGGLGRSVIRCATNELEIILLLDRTDPVLAPGFAADQLVLFCAPAINLFARRSDRINVSPREVEHLIVPDRMRPLDYEVFAVRSVEGFSADGGPPRPFLPFFAANDLSINPGQRAYYTLRRQPRQLSSRARQRGPRSAYIGHDTFISLVDADHTPLKHELRQIGLELLCTNRDLPIAMPVGRQATDFTVTVSAPVSSIRCIVGPTPPRPVLGEGDFAWRFISHLGLNYLSLTDTDRIQGATALREMLRLYVPAAQSLAARQVDGVLSVQAEPVVRRIPGSGPVAAGRGLQVTLTIDEAPFGGAGAILLAAVLDRFFAKYVSINSFTQTRLRSLERGEVMRWPIRFGLRAIL